MWCADCGTFSSPPCQCGATGIYQPGLFRSAPHRTRLAHLVESFDLTLPLPLSPSASSSAHPSQLSPNAESSPAHTPTSTRTSLRTESTADVCALLKAYLAELPEPLLDADVTAALYRCCVLPSVVRAAAAEAEAEAEAEDGERECGVEANGGYFDLAFDPSPRPRTSAHPRARSAPPPPLPLSHAYSSALPLSHPYSSAYPTPSALSYANHPHPHANPHSHANLHSLSHSFPYPAPAPLLTPSERQHLAHTAEHAQIRAAQHLLRLAPPAACALFAYLVGFFTQLPLSPDNGIALEDVVRLFGRALAGEAGGAIGPSGDERKGDGRERRDAVLMWLLERWARVSEGLFEVAPEDEDVDFDFDLDPDVSLDGGLSIDVDADADMDTEMDIDEPDPSRPPQALSTEHLAVSVEDQSIFGRPHSASVSSCESDGAASVASTVASDASESSEAESASVRTPGTEPPSLFAVAEEEAEGAEAEAEGRVRVRWAAALEAGVGARARWVPALAQGASCARDGDVRMADGGLYEDNDSSSCEDAKRLMDIDMDTDMAPTCEYPLSLFPLLPLWRLGRLCVLAVLMLVLLADEVGPPDAAYPYLWNSYGHSLADRHPHLHQRRVQDQHPHTHTHLDSCAQPHPGTGGSSASRSWPASPRLKAVGGVVSEADF